jgi:5-methylcytosine-specific restriction protein A
LRPEFRPLFTDAELEEASKRIGALPPITKRTSVSPELNFPETLPESETYIEGAIRRIVVNAYERDARAREACLLKHGRRCFICNISFEDTYGDIGRGFIHVHHKKPLALIRSEYILDPGNDLIPVCPNCHAMLHTSNPPLAVEYLNP